MKLMDAVAEMIFVTNHQLCVFAVKINAFAKKDSSERVSPENVLKLELVPNHLSLLLIELLKCFVLLFDGKLSKTDIFIFSMIFVSKKTFSNNKKIES